MTTPTPHPYAEVIDLMDRAAKPDLPGDLDEAAARAEAIGVVASAIEGLTWAPASAAQVAVAALIEAGLLDR